MSSQAQAAEVDDPYPIGQLKVERRSMSREPWS